MFRKFVMHSSSNYVRSMCNIKVFQRVHSMAMAVYTTSVTAVHQQWKHSRAPPTGSKKLSLASIVHSCCPSRMFSVGAVRFLSEGIFSKHGGKMVMGFIGGIGLWFLRSHLGGKALDAVKDEVRRRADQPARAATEKRCFFF